MADDQNGTSSENDSVSERHKNELEFDRDFTTWDKLRDKNLITPEAEERVRRDLEQAKQEADNKKKDE